MGRTTISWTEFSINPLRARNRETGSVGHYCRKTSPGCEFCYAARWQFRLGTKLDFVGGTQEHVDLFLDEAALEQVRRRRKPTKFFWCDMTDMFLEGIPAEWVDRCFESMEATPQHVHQVLTKRPERMAAYFERDGRTVPGNVWLGTSIEDQERAEKRIPALRACPARLRFLSLEPILEPVDLDLDGIHWVIFGGESGLHMFDAETRRRRGGLVDYLDRKWMPTQRGVELATSIRDQCQRAGVKFFLKQFGGAYPKSAGRILDGRTWEEFPA